MRAAGEWLMGVGYWLALPNERLFVEQAGFRKVGGWMLTFAIESSRHHADQQQRKRTHIKPNKRGRP
jgi:hypothetical protein